MTGKVIEKLYRPNPWIYGLSGLLLLIAGILWLLFLNPARQVDAQGQAASTETSVAATAVELEREAQSYEVWLEKEPNNEKALRGLLDIRLKQENLAKAVIPLEGLTRLYPSNFDYLILLGQVKQQLVDYEGAASAYKRILLEDPTHVKASQGMVDLLLVQNRPEGAIGFLQDTLKAMGKAQADQAAAINSEKVTSLQLMLGQVYVSQKRFTEAIAVYEQASNLNQTDFRPVLAQAILLKEQAQEAAAKPFFTRAIALAPAIYRDQIKDLALLDEADLGALESQEQLQTTAEKAPEPEAETPKSAAETTEPETEAPESEAETP